MEDITILSTQKLFYSSPNTDSFNPYSQSRIQHCTEDFAFCVHKSNWLCVDHQLIPAVISFLIHKCHYIHSFSSTLSLPIVSDVSFPLGMFLKGMATTGEPPPLAFHIFPPCFPLPLYQQLFHAYSPLLYPSILHLAFLS